MSKHNFKLVKTFEYDDFKNDTKTKEFNLELISLVVFGNDNILSYVVKNNEGILNKWLIEHGALIGETIHICTYKKD